MSVSTINQVAAEIDAHIRKCGGAYSAWYVGIASDPRERLFAGHKVRENGDAWIHRDAGSSSAARRIEQHFLGKGCRGGGGGGDASSRHVYAYKVTSLTKE